MPLFHDPDRRRQYLRSGEESEHEAPAPGSSSDPQDKEDHRGSASPELSGITWQSPSRDFSPSRMWTNDRQELIQRIKESSPWRLEYTVCWKLRRPICFEAKSVFAVLLCFNIS